MERLVEGFCVMKHLFHIRHFGHVPVANLAVFVHNALLPISAAPRRRPRELGRKEAAQRADV